METIVTLIVFSVFSSGGAVAWTISRLAYKEQRLLKGSPRRILKESQKAQQPDAMIGSNTKLNAIEVYAEAPSPEPETYTKEDFLQCLTEFENGWLRKLLNAPLVIEGGMGSYKSRVAAFLAASRRVLRDHELDIADPHAHLNPDVWNHLNCPVVGHNKNGVAIKKAIQNFRERLSQAQPNSNWNTTIFDEATNYKNYPDLKDELGRILMEMTSDTRKAHEAPIVIVHGSNRGYLGLTEGIITEVKSKLLWLKLDSDIDADGNPYPLYKGTLFFPGNGYQRITLESEWMNAPNVTSIFSQCFPKLPELSDNKPLAPIKSDCGQLEQHLREILQYARKRQGWVKAAEVQRDNASLKDIPTIRIRQLFGQLYSLGYGELQGDGDRTQFRAA